MAEVKWVKISTDLFDNEKIKYLLTLKDGNEIVLCWIKLLLLAGKCNEKGGLFLSKNVEIPEKFLRKYLEITPKKFKKYLEIFEKLSMIFYQKNIIFIANWEKYQNAKSLEKISRDTKERAEKYKTKKTSEIFDETGIRRKKKEYIRNKEEKEEEKEMKLNGVFLN